MIGKIAFIALLILASCSSFKQKEQKTEIQKHFQKNSSKTKTNNIFF